MGGIHQQIFRNVWNVVYILPPESERRVPNVWQQSPSQEKETFHQGDWEVFTWVYHIALFILKAKPEIPRYLNTSEKTELLQRYVVELRVALVCFGCHCRSKISAKSRSSTCLAEVLIFTNRKHFMPCAFTSQRTCILKESIAYVLKVTWVDWVKLLWNVCNYRRFH